MPVLCRIYGSNTYSSIYTTYDTDGDAEPGKYTSGLYLRNGAAGMEYDASGAETMNIIHGYNGGASSPMYFRFGGSAGNIRMTLNDAGHLGIGISTPCGALDVYKPSSGGSGTGDNLIVRGGNSATLFGSNQIRFGFAGGIGYSHAIKSRHQSGSPGNNALDFFIWTTADAAETTGTKLVMTLDGTGAVGIGTCSPNIAGFTGNVLTINGTGNYQGLEIGTSGTTRMTMVSDGLNGYVSTRQAGMCIIFEAGAASEKMRITSAGNVGIGTATPGSNLHIQGLSASGADFGAELRVWENSFGAQIQGSTLGNTYAFFGNFRYNFAGETCSRNNYYNAGHGLLFKDGVHIFSSQPGGTSGCMFTPLERFTINNSGFIGVGTVSPDTKLTIQSVCNDEKSFSIRSSYSVCVPVFEAGTTGADGYLKIRDGANCTWTSLSGYSATPTYLLNSVGIGITTPSYKLHVNGTFYAAGSSQDYKQGICQYNTDSCLFMCLKPKTYQYKDEWKHLGKELKSGTQIGLIAEEVAESHPELAILVNEEDNKVVRNVDYEKLTIILLSELQKLRQEVDQLKNK